jgi:hypothetical protein
MSTENLSSLTRQDLTRLACDALAGAGKKPSIGLVREWTITTAGAKKGSDGDVQKDINLWGVTLDEYPNSFLFQSLSA